MEPDIFDIFNILAKRRNHIDLHGTRNPGPREGPRKGPFFVGGGRLVSILRAPTVTKKRIVHFVLIYVIPLPSILEK